MRSLLFKKVSCYPPHSVACQGCYTHSLASRGDPRLSAADPAFLFPSFLFLDQWLVPDFQDLSRPAVAWPSSVGATAAETNGLTIRHNSPSFWGRPLTNSAPAH